MFIRQTLLPVFNNGSISTTVVVEGGEVEATANEEEVVEEVDINSSLFIIVDVFCLDVIQDDITSINVVETTLLELLLVLLELITTGGKKEEEVEEEELHTTVVIPLPPPFLAVATNAEIELFCPFVAVVAAGEEPAAERGLLGGGKCNDTCEDTLDVERALARARPLAEWHR